VKIMARELIILPNDDVVLKFYRELEEFAGRLAKELKLDEPEFIYTSDSIDGPPLDVTITIPDCCDID